MIRRGKCRTIENNKWQRQEYIKESNSGTTKDAIKIKLHLYQLKANYGRKSLGNRCPMCQSEEVHVEHAEHVLKCHKGDKKFNFNDKRGK